MSKPTPGPWTADKATLWIYGPKGENIGTLFHSSETSPTREEAEANLQRIIKASNMHERLLREVCRYGDLLEAQSEKEKVEAIDALIAEAEGK